MKLNKLRPILLLTIYLLGCDRTNDKLFWIKENTENRSDFLFLAESTNIGSLKVDSLKFFFGADELMGIDTTSISFKNFGKIYVGQKFNAFVLLQTIDTFGRNYAFIIRTYDKDFNLIDSFELGIWNEKEKQYCFGSIDKNLMIERRCNFKETSDIMQITNEGKIVMAPS